MERVSNAYKLRLFLIFAACYGIFYIYPNFNLLSESFFLPLLPADKAMPFLPWTFFIYVSDYLLCFCAISLVDGKKEFDALARSIFLVLFISGGFFFFFPTIYPRPPYPEVASPALALLMDLVQIVDQPNNCFPSMHVALTAAATWALRHHDRRLFAGFVVWSCAIFLSTMTTKQHYFVDILGGLGVVAVVAVLEKAIFSKVSFPFFNLPLQA